MLFGGLTGGLTGEASDFRCFA